MTWDAIVSKHLNPFTCGVAKFNQELARRLNIPLARWPDARKHRWPLLSCHPHELSDVYDWPYPTANAGLRCDLFLHSYEPRAKAWMANALTVYAANPEIAAQARESHPRVVETFCPSLLQGNPTTGTYTVLAFGMAQKLNVPQFEQLKAQLEREHPDYTIHLSTAVHEGSPWDEALQQSTEAMRAIFGDKLRVLGFLGDDALAKELASCDAVAAYFTPALRANNTSAWAALAAGKPLYTNTDALSPPLDVSQHTWEKLLQVLSAA
jgi:hypothetical protein